MKKFFTSLAICATVASSAFAANTPPIPFEGTAQTVNWKTYFSSSPYNYKESQFFSDGDTFSAGNISFTFNRSVTYFYTKTTTNYDCTLRIGKNSGITFDIAEGYQITGIAFVCERISNGTPFPLSVNSTASTGELYLESKDSYWYPTEKNTTSVTVTNGDKGMARLVDVIFYYAPLSEEVDPTPANDIAEIYNLGTEDPELTMLVDFPVTVTYQDDMNTYITDGITAAVIFNDLVPRYNTGDIIPAGWTTKYVLTDDYTPQLLPVELPAASTEVNDTYRTGVAKEITVEMVNEVIILADVEITEATPADMETFEVAYNEQTVTLYNAYELPSQPADSYDILGVVTVVDGEPQVNVIKYAGAKTLGIGNISVKDEAPVYYDLQGRRVLNPTKGIYIKGASLVRM